MPRPLSVALRTRIVHACAAQEFSQAEIAELFEVHVKTVEKLWKQWRETQSVAPKPHAGGRATRLAPHYADLRTWLAEQSDRTQAELRALLSQHKQIAVSQSMLSRAGHVGAATKKKSLTATERHRAEVVAARTAFRATVDQMAAQDLVFVDESGVTTSMTRRYGRAPKGQRVPEAVPHSHWQVMTMIGALGATGIQAALTVDAATDADIFTVFVEKILAPTLRAGQVVVMDNLSAHKDARVQEVLAAHGCQLVYLPPYSPDLNPIEPAWSKIKSQLRSLKARTWDVLEKGVGAAVQAISAQDARGYFAHGGYTL